MKKLFNNILVPVDFSKNSKRALEKAIDIADTYNCTIHLLHVVAISSLTTGVVPDGHIFIPDENVYNQEELESNLQELKKSFSGEPGKERIIHIHLQRGLWDESMINFVEQHNIDVIIVGLQGKGLLKRRMHFDVNRIAEKTNIPVITVPENRRLISLMSIVIPITDFLPVKKLLYGIYLAEHDKATIKLVGVQDEKNPEQCKKVQHYLKKSFLLIRDNSSVPVEIITTTGKNVAEAINQYAFKNSMDLVIVNPGKQSRMPGIFSSFLGNFLQKFSAPPVLTVNPI